MSPRIGSRGCAGRVSYGTLASDSQLGIYSHIPGHASLVTSLIVDWNPRNLRSPQRTLTLLIRSVDPLREPRERQTGDGVLTDDAGDQCSGHRAARLGCSGQYRSMRRSEAEE